MIKIWLLEVTTKEKVFQCTRFCHYTLYKTSFCLHFKDMKCYDIYYDLCILFHSSIFSLFSNCIVERRTPECGLYLTAFRLKADLQIFYSIWLIQIIKKEKGFQCTKSCNYNLYKASF